MYILLLILLLGDIMVFLGKHGIISVAAVFKQFSTGISVVPVIIKNDTTRNSCQQSLYNSMFNYNSSNKQQLPK